MPASELMDYIKKSRNSGITDSTIKQSLLSAGWDEAQVNDGLGLTLARTTSSKGWVWVVAGLVILGGGIFAYFNFYNPTPPTGTKINSNPTTEISTTTGPNDVNTPLTPPSDNQPAPVVTEINCGQAGAVHSQNDPSFSGTAETKQAYQCFVDSLNKCQPATIQVALDANNPENFLTFKIDSGSTSECKVSGPRADIMTGELSSGSCLVSSQWLDQYFINSQEANSRLIKGYLLVSQVLLGGEKVVTLPDGAIVKATCN